VLEAENDVALLERVVDPDASNVENGAEAQ